MTDQTQAPAPEQSAQEEDPNIVGKLNDEEMAQWQQSRQMATQTVMELGNMVVRAVRLVGNINQAENAVQNMLKAAASRMGLADDTKFQALPDGRIRVLANIQPTTVTPDQAPAPAEEAEAPAQSPMDEVAKAKAAAEQAESTPPA